MRRALLIIAALAVSSCSTEEIVPEPYRPTDAYDAYRHGLEQAGLAATALGRDWLAVGREAVAAPLGAEAPLEESGYLDPAVPTALGYRFAALRGQRLEVAVEVETEEPLRLFLDLYRLPEEDRGELVHVATADEGERRLAFEPRRDAEYVLRLQPELLRGGRYALRLRLVPSLEFPVEAHSTADIQSSFGAPRDAGRRRHHGVDIFAPRGTPVVATSRAWVRRVEERDLGGKVVWLQDRERSLNLYYAHLDSQEVEEGVWVEPGDIVGRVGNTGNARTTPPHLHFGIYVSRQGPVDPHPFLNQPRQRFPRQTVSDEQLGSWGRASIASASLRVGPGRQFDVIEELDRHTAMRLQAAAGAYYRVALPDGRRGYVAGAQVESAEAPISTAAVADGGRVLVDPSPRATWMRQLPAGAEVPVLGRFGEFLWIQTPEGRPGWLTPD